MHFGFSFKRNSGRRHVFIRPLFPFNVCLKFTWVSIINSNYSYQKIINSNYHHLNQQFLNRIKSAPFDSPNVWFIYSHNIWLCRENIEPCFQYNFNLWFQYLEIIGRNPNLCNHPKTWLTCGGYMKTHIIIVCFLAKS